MSGLDIEDVLRDHWPVPVFGCECTPIDEESGERAVLEMSWEAHVAAVLREQIAAWLEGEAVNWASCSPYSAGALRALAAQVARVDPSRSPPSRVPGETS